MSLFIDDLQLHNRAGGWYFDLVVGRHSLPSLRTVTTLIPFAHGLRGEPSFADQRRLELESRLLAVPDPDAHQAFLDSLKRHLDPTRTTPVLVRDLLPTGVERWCRAWPRALDVERVGGRTATPMHAASAVLEALDPFWYTSWGALTLDSGLALDDDEELDTGGETIVIPPTDEIDLDAIGSTDVARIRIRFIGPSAGPVGIEVISTPEPIGFTSTVSLGVGERVTVDNAARSAHRDIGTVIGTVRGAMTLRPGNRHGEYVRLVPGINRIRIHGAPAQTRIKYLPTWL